MKRNQESETVTAIEIVQIGIEEIGAIDWRAQSGRFFAIDFTSVARMSAELMREVFHLGLVLNQHRRRLLLTGMCPQVRRQALISRLHQIADILNTEEEAGFLALSAV